MNASQIPKKGRNIYLPLYGTAVSCGFTSPADDYVSGELSLDEHLIHRPSSTFFVRASGDSMTGVGIFDGDLLIVDRSVTAKPGQIVLAVLENEFLVKEYAVVQGRPVLKPANPDYPDIPITEEMDFLVWGVVIHTVRSL